MGMYRAALLQFQGLVLCQQLYLQHGDFPLQKLQTVSLHSDKAGSSVLFQV